MRSRGARFECLRMRPGDHIGWTFAGQAGFAELARPFLAEGAARGERLMYVAADPDPAAVAGLPGPPAIQVASIAEVYGASGLVDAPRQRAIFATALAQAQAEGYSGIRVAADNTPLVTDETRLAAWIRWEVVADRFMSENPVTGLCAFDVEKVDVDRLRHLATLHPLSSADSPLPQFRLFADSGQLRAEGHIDSFAVSQFRPALEMLPPRTHVLVDLSAATLTRTALADIAWMCGDGVTVIIRGEPSAVSRLRVPSLPSSRHLILEEDGQHQPTAPSVAPMPSGSS